MANGDVEAEAEAGPEAEANGGAKADHKAETKAQPTPSLTLGKGGGGTTPAAPAAGTAPAAGVASPIQVNNWSTAPGNPSRTRTRVGVGEMVELSTQGRGGTWSATRSFPGGSGAIGGGSRAKYMWQAPDTAGTATITYTPSTGEARTIEMQVVAPSAITFTNPQPIPFASAGAAMRNDVEIGPRDVSFENAQWKEAAGAAAQPRAVQGYFRRYQQNGGDLVHHPETQWLDMDSTLNDTAGVGGLPPLDNGRWSDGSFHWDIPNRYTVGRAGEGHVFATSRQGFRITENGSVTVTKGGQSVTAAANPDNRMSAIGAPAEDREQLRTMLRGEGLELLLDRLRDGKDEPTKAIIRDIIRERSPRIKITLRCTNSYSWFSADSIMITVNNRPTARGRFSIDTNQTTSDTIGLWGVYDLAALERGPVPALDINVRAEDHDLQTRIVAVFRDSDFANLNDRYQLRYELLGHHGSNQGSGATGDL